VTRRAKIVGFASALAIAAFGVALLFRAPLLESVLRAALAARGVPSVEIDVESFGLREIVLADLALGAQGEARAKSIVVAYHPRDLLAGRLEALDIDGLTLALDLSGAGPPLGSLQSLVAASDDGAATHAVIPTVTLRDTEVRSATPLGPLATRIEGRLGPDPAGNLSAALRFDAEGAPGRLRGAVEATQGADDILSGKINLEDGALTFPGAELRGLTGTGNFSALGAELRVATLDLSLGEISLPGVTFERARAGLRLDEQHLDLMAELATGDGELALNVEAALDDVPERPAGKVRVAAEAGAGAALWPLLALPAPAAGRIRAEFSTQGRLPKLADIVTSNPETLPRQIPEDFSGQAVLHIEGVSYPGTLKDFSGEVRLDTHPSPETPNRLLGTLALDLKAAGASHGDIQAQSITLNQKLSVETNFEQASATIGDKGKISLGRLTKTGTFASAGPLTAQVDAGTVSGTQSGDISFDLTLTPRPIKLKLGSQASAIQVVTFETKALRANGNYRAADGVTGQLQIDKGSLALPDLAVTAEGLAATADLHRDGGGEAKFAIATLRHTATPPVLAPLQVTGRAKTDGKAIEFSAKGTDLDGLASLTLSGRQDLTKGRGTARFGLAPLTFAPGAVQPVALFPGLTGLKDVTGQARAEAQASWGAKALSGSAALNLEDIAFDSETARVEGLSLQVALDRLQPPSSAPGQTLTVRRIDPGVPIEDLSVRFQILPRKVPAVAIENAGLNLAGGRIRLADVVIDTGDRPENLPVEVEALNLHEVFDLLGVEGLAGEGKLSGTIPLRLAGGALSVKGGRLAAEAPGRLQIESNYARQALSAAGESADLLLRALADFYYDELSLTIDQPSEDLALVGLSMLGHNPAVLDGYPFRFNVNLETDPRKLIGALQDALQISNLAIRQLWMPGR